jgi:protein gp37
MGDRSAIGWTDATWNPVTGCDKVSPGCAHCYAETFAERWRGTPGHPFEQGFDLKLWPDRLDKPLRWRKPRMVFVNSMSDLFHEDIPDEFIADVWVVMMLAERHVFQVLTKRPERMRDLLGGGMWPMLLADAFKRRDEPIPFWPEWELLAPPNIWLGVSIENRRFVDRADVLRDTPAAVRFISAEPLLGPLVKACATTPDTPRVERPFSGTTCRDCGRAMDTWQWQCSYTDCSPDRWPDGYRGPELNLIGIDWLIAGGESGPRHRRIDEQWVSDLRDACQATRIGDERPDTAFFFKQWGGHRPTSNGRELDGRTWDEMPRQVVPV